MFCTSYKFDILIKIAWWDEERLPTFGYLPITMILGLNFFYIESVGCGRALVQRKVASFVTKKVMGLSRENSLFAKARVMLCNIDVPPPTLVKWEPWWLGVAECVGCKFYMHLGSF